MQLQSHVRNGQTITEVVGEGVLFRDVASAFQVLIEIAYSGSSQIIFHANQFVPEFFELKTGLLGEFLQKASNYRVQVAFVGDFENVQSESLRAFIVESNRGMQNFFVRDLASAIEALR